MNAGHDPAVRRRARWLIGLFIAGLVFSGLTAFPLQLELDFLVATLGGRAFGAPEGTMAWWILTVRNGLGEIYRDHPWVGYGTDWLGFGHLVIALFFVPAWRDPMRHRWVLKVGLIACAAVIPMALLAGAVRGIPLGWRMIDCSFGVCGAIPLWLALRMTTSSRDVAG